MKRKYGFTLVELLIVLAVIAALIATITPLALNAIRRAKASQVAQNLRSLASALENAAYVNDLVTADGADKGKIAGARGEAIVMGDLARDIDMGNYAVTYLINAPDVTEVLDDDEEVTGYEFSGNPRPGTIFVWVYSTADADLEEVQKIMREVKEECSVEPNAAEGSISILVEMNDDLDIDDANFVYEFYFNIY